jgi:hypothetical protein
VEENWLRGRALSRQPALLQAARPGALCGRRKVERHLRHGAWGLFRARKPPCAWGLFRARKPPLTSSLGWSRSMARNGLRTQPPCVDPSAADCDGRRIPFASIPHHTLILLAHASDPYSLPRPRKGNFTYASRFDGPRNLLELQALHPAQPSSQVLYCSDFTFTLLQTDRSLDHRNPTGAQHATSARSGFLIVCCSDCTPASFPYASASFTHSLTLSLESC